MSKIIIGIVASNKGDKTIVVKVVGKRTHPLYKKSYSVTNKIMAHDEKNECQVGDKVSIVETRPISKNKRFKLVEVLERPTVSAEDKAVVEASAEVLPKAVLKEQIQQVEEKPAKVTKK